MGNVSIWIITFGQNVTKSHLLGTTWAEARARAEARSEAEEARAEARARGEARAEAEEARAETKAQHSSEEAMADGGKG